MDNINAHEMSMILGCQLCALISVIIYVYGAFTNEYDVSAALFLRGLLVAYLMHFGSFAWQADGLLGRYGLVPLIKTISDHEKWQTGVLNRPSPLWTARYITLPLKRGLYSALKAGTSGGGAGGKIMEMCAYMGALICLSGAVLDSPTVGQLLLCWVFAFLVKHVGGTFMNFQWDILLLEVGAIGVFLQAAHSRLSRSALVLALHLVHLRLLFGSGWVKITSGCLAWRQLEATRYHFFTQPLPRPVAALVSRAPPAVHKVLTGVIVYGELLVPILAAVPSLRVICVPLLVLLQCSVACTGHYGFFSFLSTALACTCLTNKQWSLVVQSATRAGAGTPLGNVLSLIEPPTLSVADLTCLTTRLGAVTVIGDAHMMSWVALGTLVKEYVVLLVAACLCISSLVSLLNLFVSKGAPHFPGLMSNGNESNMTSHEADPDTDKDNTERSDTDDGKHATRPLVLKAPWPLAAIHDHLLPFYCGFSYGLFARMTTTRPELTVLIRGPGSEDASWTPIEFCSKPGESSLGCKAVWPPFSLPRLDWRMWFLALTAAGTLKRRLEVQAKNAGDKTGKMDQPHTQQTSESDAPRWFWQLLIGIVEGSRECLSLLTPETSDFRNAALGGKPSSTLEVKVDLYDYRFVSGDSAQWEARRLGEFVAPQTLDTLLEKTYQLDVNDRAAVRNIERNTAANIIQGLAEKLQAVKKTKPKTS